MGNTENKSFRENTLFGRKIPISFIHEIIKYFGLAIIQFLASLFILTHLLFYAGISVNPGIFFSAILITFLILFLSLFYDKTGNYTLKRTIILSTIIFIGFSILVVISVMFGSMFIDPSYDSNAYHKPYSLFFINGWNPIQDQNPPELFNGKLLGSDHKGNTYPKASEIVASYFYLFSGTLESVKAINLIILFSALAIAIITFLSFLPEKKLLVIILSLVAVLNPVWITQSTQFSIDGFTYELFFIIICLILLYVKGHQNWYILLSLLLASILLLSTKGSALLFIPLIMVLLLLLVWIYCKPKTRDIIVFLIILLDLLCIIGFSPYIENYSKYGSPLGMEFGGETLSSPEKFTQFYTGYTNDHIPNWLVPRDLFIRSLFSPVSSKYEGIKNPFDINLLELNNLHGSTTINGYGPFCGLIILLSLFCLITILFSKKNQDLLILLISIFFIFLTVILHPACWWARFVPQFFLIPVFIALIGYVNGNDLSRAGSSFLLLVLVLNILFVGHHIYLVSTIETQAFDHSFMEIKNEAQFPVGLNNTFSNAVNSDLASPVSAVLLEEKGIPWQICGNNFSCINMTKQKKLVFSTEVLYSPKPQ